MVTIKKRDKEITRELDWRRNLHLGDIKAENSDFTALFIAEILQLSRERTTGRKKLLLSLKNQKLF